MSIADLRREYNLMGLRRSDLEADPIKQFQRWFEQATGARAGGRLRKFFIGVYKSIFMFGGGQYSTPNRRCNRLWQQNEQLNQYADG